MRKESICISERSLMFCIAGQLYDQAPARFPRNADTIMQKVREKIRSDFYNGNEYYTLVIGSDELYGYIEKMLKDIPEFVDLNLTQVEAEKGVSVDDESRPKYGFSSRYDVHTDESWKHDFIDLDAFIGNVVGMVRFLRRADDDCFLCVHEKKNEEVCKTCTVNPAYKNCYQCEREPKGEHKFACKHDCYKSYYICCEECKTKDTCEQKCDGNSESCGNAINRI